MERAGLSWQNGDTTAAPAGRCATLSPRRVFGSLGLPRSRQQRLSVCRSSMREDLFLLFFRCLLRCMESPQTLTLFGSCAVVVSER